MVDLLNFEDARHLVSRTTFGVSWPDVNQLVGRRRHEAVERIIKSHSIKTAPPPKMTAWSVHQKMRENSNMRMMSHRKMVAESSSIKQWWVGQMLKTRTPLTEKMTLLWHGHFTSSFDKVEQADLLYKQNQLLRRHSMGNFGSLLKAISKDPAMMLYLDTNGSNKHKANENFPRELMELFTLGGTRYHSEIDVKQVAQIFTGWHVDRTKGISTFHQADHNAGVYTVLGKQARSIDDVINILLLHPRTAVHIAEKFWYWFVSDQKPDYTYIQQWAHHFRRSNYEISVLLGEVLRSDAFWSARYRGTITKSPADLVVGTLRTLPYPRLSNKELTRVFRLLGQDLFDPPNVKGWEGGAHWINTQTLLVRTSLLTKLSRGSLNRQKNRGYRFPNASSEQLRRWLLATSPIMPSPQTPGKVRLIRSLVLDPTYQLT